MQNATTEMDILALKEKILRWFAEWAKLKPHIHFSDTVIFPQRREIW